MPKFKSKSADIIRFDYKGAEKVIEPGKTYELDEDNDYIQGLIAFGLLEAKELEPEPEIVEPETEAPVIELKKKKPLEP